MNKKTEAIALIIGSCLGRILAVGATTAIVAYVGYYIYQ